ncbi:MAG: hydroxyisourate hydrolase [Robiginitomaculum sp.]|nr:MAG: hydroxyisourate hydrolase [Robiginitomaculum sp.]
MAGLTTHVLDTANGCPAEGMQVRLFVAGDPEPLFSGATNADGRCDAPLLTPEQVKVGQYVLEFGVGDYFRAKGHKLPDPAFLERVSISFGLADVDSHYHVPLLVSPFAYSTYRGS